MTQQPGPEYGPQYGPQYGPEYGPEYGTRPYGDALYQPYQPWDQPYSPYGQTSNPYGQPPAPPAPPKRRRGVITASVAAIAAVGIFAAGVATGSSNSVNGTGSTGLALGPSANGGSSNGGSSNGGSSNGSSNGGPSFTNPFGNYPFGGGNGNGGNSSSSVGQATAAQSVGVVDIYTRLGYQGAAAAGTGVVLSSDGEILTNNHVINGSTTIRAVVVSTGKSYTGQVVGTVPTKDIALVKLQNASGLQTANLGDSSNVSVGDAVTGVGNAGGTGGTPSAAHGKVTALHKTITASDEDGSGSERLHNVIVTNAPIQPGDSGGPLYDAQGKIVGIDTAASTNGRGVGFAIAINDALHLVTAIKSGVETSSVHLGYPGFLGVSIAGATGRGALIETVVNGGPAEKAGIAAGDVITRVDGSGVRTAAQLKKAVSTKNPGARVAVTYTDQVNTSHTVTVTLATGPAD